MMIFCKHKWKLVSETLTKSELEIDIEAKCTSAKNANAKRKLIQLVACDKCGKIKKFVEVI